MGIVGMHGDTAGTGAHRLTKPMVKCGVNRKDSEYGQPQAYRQTGKKAQIVILFGT